MKLLKLLYNNKEYSIPSLNNNLKIFICTDPNCIGGLSVVYYDEKTQKIKKKNFNSNSFTSEKVSTKALLFLKDIYNVDRKTYLKIINMYTQSLVEKSRVEKIEILNLLKNTKRKVKKKHIYKV